MKFTAAMILVVSLVVAQRTMAADPVLPTTRTAKVRIVLAGDSTVTDDAGWGGVFAKWWNQDVEIINLSRGGRSSSSFIKEGRWKTTLDLKPDYVLIQFGHNDQPGHGDRETDPATTYRQYMTQYVDEAIAAGIKPVLVTSLSRREFNKNGRIESKLTPWVETVKAIAREKNVPLIDLHWRSIEVYESLGVQGVRLISPFKKDAEKKDTEVLDGTHLNSVGGKVFGPLVADELRRAVPELGKYLKAPPQPTTQPGTAPTQPTTAPVPSPLLSEPFETPTPKGAKTITVAQDGSGDYLTVQEAIAASPANNADRTTIKIKPGTYIGQVIIPKSRPNISLIGENKDTTIISYALNVYDPVPDNTVPRANGNGVVVLGADFIASDLTFRTTSGDHGQAMALRMQADRAVVKNCKLLGWQDTLLVHSGRQYFKDTYIEGRVDFIYGGSVVVFDNCEIKSKNGGYVTAASTAETEPFGYVFLNCKLTSDDGVPAYLGRPWRPFGAVAYINCEMGSHIRPEGWHNWGKVDNEKTARYSEYKTTGPGANPEKRVPWSKQLADEEAAKYTPQNVLAGKDGWDPTK